MKPVHVIIVCIGAFLGYTFYEPEIQKAYQDFSAAPEPEVIFQGGKEDELKAEIARINSILDKYEKKLLEKKPDIPNPPKEECECGGTGKIKQGDGNVTDCTCPKPCQCKKPATSEILQQKCECSKIEMKTFINEAVTTAFNNYAKGYREQSAKQSQAADGLDDTFYDEMELPKVDIPLPPPKFGGGLPKVDIPFPPPKFGGELPSDPESTKASEQKP